jgi:hypothetical protein
MLFVLDGTKSEWKCYHAYSLADDVYIRWRKHYGDIQVVSYITNRIKIAHLHHLSSVLKKPSRTCSLMMCMCSLMLFRLICLYYILTLSWFRMCNTEVLTTSPPWWWRQQAPVKRRSIFTRLYCTTSKKTLMFKASEFLCRLWTMFETWLPLHSQSFDLVRNENKKTQWKPGSEPGYTS